jgi:4-hydroxy-2-oxoheptanedioate aldolase
MIESTQAIENLDDMLANVPGIGFVPDRRGRPEPGTGLARQYEHPEVLDAMRQIVETCHKHKVVVGNPHTTAKNYERLLNEGYKLPDVGPAAQLRRDRQGARNGGVLR